MKAGSLISAATLARAQRVSERRSRVRRSKYAVTLGDPNQYGRDRTITVWAEDAEEARRLGRSQRRAGEEALSASIVVDHGPNCACGFCEDRWAP